MRHVAQLDGVRAIAVLIVMASHTDRHTIVPGGFGVTIFFFLSGYLITSLLRSERCARGTIDLRAFYFRRVLRIMPPLYMTLLLLTIGSYFGLFGAPAAPAAVAADYALLSNYAHLWTGGAGLPVPLWSLAVEEHFYLLFPLAFMFILAKRSGASAARLCIIACLAVLGLRFLTLVGAGELWHNYYWSHTRMDSILFGCCLALWQNPTMDDGAWRPQHWHALAATVAIVLTFIIRNDIFRATLRYSVQGSALFVLFSYVLSERSRVVTRLLRSKMLAWVGLLSYTLYLCHFAIFAALQAKLQLGPLGIGLLGTPLAFAYAYAMHLWVERPIVEWRRNRWRSSKVVMLAVQRRSDAQLGVREPEMSDLEPPMARSRGYL